MAKKRPPTRAERRARPQPPAARVYGVVIKDAGASGRESEVAFWAISPAVAEEKLRAAELHSRVILAHLEPEQIDVEVDEMAREEPAELFLRQFNDDGATEWLRLPLGYRHPPQGSAALDPGLRLTRPVLGTDPDGRWRYRDWPPAPGQTR